MTSKKFVIYTDGASRGNPGPAAIGVVLQDESRRVVDNISLCLGNATNNQAEYRAIIAGLERALALKATHVELRSDSELVVQQLCGKYRVKNVALLPLFQKVETLRGKFERFEALYIPREQNREADKLANQALDGKQAQIQPVVVQSITIRKATQADYPPIVSIFAELEKQHVEAVPEFFRPMSHDEQIKELDDILADKNAALFVAERGGEVLGVIHLAQKESDDYPVLRPRKYVKIRDIAVAGRHAGSGVGSSLMAEAERWALGMGIHTIELNIWEFNRGAFAFCQKMGYNTASHHMWKHI